METRSTAGSKRRLPVPIQTEEVTVEWLSTVLNMQIDEKSFVLTGSVNVGVGFLSNLIRVTFLENCPDGNKKEHFLIVKLLPLIETTRQLVISEKMDKAELYSYQKLIFDLVLEVASLEPYFCPVMYAEIQEENPEENIDYASVLILKDLKTEGYITKPFSTHELTDEEVELTIDFMAKFHFAANLIECRKKAKLSDVYDFFAEWFYPNENNKSFIIHTWFKEGFQHTKNAILDHITNINPSQKECGMEIIEKMIEPFAPHAQKIFDAVILAGKEYPSAIHADLWQNNILTKSDGGKTSIKIIDWQICGYSDAAFDMAIFLATTLLPNMTMQSTEKVAKSYYDKLEQLYAEKELEGVKIPRKRRTWEEYWQFLKTYGLTYVYTQWITNGESLATSPENFPKIFESFRFFHYQAGITDFLTQLISS